MSTQRRGKRCICGRSQKMPLCDGAHRTDGWQCDAADSSVAPVTFAASYSLRNLADRLANRYQGQALHGTNATVVTHRLVLLTDGHDIERLHEITSKVTTDEVIVLSTGAAAESAKWAFPNADCRIVQDGDNLTLWTRTVAALEATGQAFQTRDTPRLFLAHSVADEQRLFPVIDCLRTQYQLPIFVCADSIPPGSDWQREIQEQLDQCDRMLFMASENANQSTFCAFETGLATALQKDIHVINLDGSRLPQHLQQIQATDVQRLLARKPWLTEQDGLLEACLESALLPRKTPAAEAEAD